LFRTAFCARIRLRIELQEITERRNSGCDTASRAGDRNLLVAVAVGNPAAADPASRVPGTAVGHEELRVVALTGSIGPRSRTSEKILKMTMTHNAATSK
jgi:hypothetical protein